MQQKYFCGNISRLNILSSSEARPKILPPITLPTFFLAGSL